jgi:hypothetical protein
MIKLTKQQALEIAIITLKLEIECGNIQGEPFDSALEKLDGYYDMGKLRTVLRDYITIPKEQCITIPKERCLRGIYTVGLNDNNR